MKIEKYPMPNEQKQEVARLKSRTIYSDKEGILRVVTVEVPKEPCVDLYADDGYHLPMSDYAYEMKDSSVPFEDLNAAAVMIYKHYRKGDLHQQAQFNIKPDTFYTVPEFEYEWYHKNPCVEKGDCMKPEPDGKCRQVCKNIYLTARLVSPQQEKVSDVSKLLGEDHIPQVIKFLLGAGTLDGLWWHEKPTDGRAPFWWRKHLRELYNKPSETNQRKNRSRFV